MGQRQSGTAPALRARALTILLAAAAVMVLGLWGSSLGLAHSYLIHSYPAANAVVEAPPPELRLWFSEAPEVRLSQVRLLDSSGGAVEGLGILRVDQEDASLLWAPIRGLRPGAYTVVWRVTSAVDGHVASGSFAFTVGPGQAPTDEVAPASMVVPGPTGLEIATRWMGYLGMALLAGGLVFAALVLNPHALPRPLLGLVAAGWALTLSASLAGAVVQAVGVGGSDLSGTGSTLLTLLGGTRYGVILWVRLLLLAVLAGLLLYGVRGGKDRPTWLWPAGSAVALLVLLTTSLNSHAAASPFPFSAVAGDWVHLASASIWLGGLMALVAVLAPLRRSSSHTDPGVMTQVVVDFSFLATLCIVALGTTGLLQALDHLASWEDLFDTPYGTALLAKLGLLLPLFGLAAANRSLAKQLGRSGKDVLAKAPGPWQGRILRNAGGEIVVGVVVLLVTSVLTALVPAHDAFGPGLVLRSQESGVRAVLVASPGLPGINRFDVHLKEQLWSPVEEAEKVALIFSSKEQGIGQTEAVAADQGGGHYSVQGNYLSVESTWQIELLVRRSGQDDVRLDFTVPESELSEERFSRGGHVH